jgi:host factor-I protein
MSILSSGRQFLNGNAGFYIISILPLSVEMSAGSPYRNPARNGSGATLLDHPAKTRSLSRYFRVIWRECCCCPEERRSAMENKPAQNIQDSFLNTARKEKTIITIYLMSGVKLTGRIRSFDKYSVVLETNNQEQLIFKHAISTVVMPRGTHEPRAAVGESRSAVPGTVTGSPATPTAGSES